MKRIHFKYSALTLALMGSFAVLGNANAAEVVQYQYINGQQNFVLQDKVIKSDRNGLYLLAWSNMRDSQIKNVDFETTHEQTNIVHISDSTNVTIDNITMNVDKPTDLSSVIFQNSTVTLNNSTIDVATKMQTDPNTLVGSLLIQQTDATVNNSTITNNAEKNTVIALNSTHNVTMNNTSVNATGNHSTLFTAKDYSKLITNNVTATNSGNNGLFLTIKGEDKKETNDIYTHNFEFNNSKITATQGIYWENDKGSLGLFLNNTTLEIKDQLVQIHNSDNVGRNITTDIQVGTNSTLSGGLKDPKSHVDITLKQGAKWNITSNSTIHSLTSAGNSDIYFEHKDDTFKTLEITDTYEGEHRFHLNSNLSKNQSDKVEILGNFGNAKSSATLNITDKSGDEMFTEPDQHKVTVLRAANTPPENFTVKLANGNEYVNAGGYRYRLSNENGDKSFDWVLTNKKGDDGKPEVDPDFKKKEEPKDSPQADQPKTEPKGDGLVPNMDGQKKAPHEDLKLPEKDNNKQQDNNKPQTKPNNGSTAKPELELNDTANNLTSLRAAQVTILDAELAGVHQRLGDVRNGKSTSVWTRSVNQTQKFDEQSVSSQSKTSGGKLDTYNLQLGADTGVTDNVRLGGFVSATAAKMDFDGSYSDAKLYSKAVALYASYLNENGFYVDGIAKYSRLRSEFNTGGTSKKDVTYHYNAYTVSTEVGREFSFANQWSVTPQVQLGWSTISGNKYEDRLNVLHSKAGVRLAKGIQTSSLNLKPFAEVNGVYDKFNHNQVTLGKQGFDVARLGGRVETAVGLGLSGGNHSFSIQANNAYGKHIKKYWSAQATYRYQW
ncbi:autotransporter outer membrane beta-barrel domain-containing protein [Lonepinella sp. MS14437]|uniref:autotransporter outer membrane beta-barrel domain-containing protein n=1 Tax=Lonepinella sp. MS14437 TaxID=3003620 RepID=UPI0036D9508C